MNYLLCLDVSTEAVHSDPQLGAAATVDTTWYWHARIGFAGQLDERMWKSNCLVSSLQEWIKAHGLSMPPVPKETREGV